LWFSKKMLTDFNRFRLILFVSVLTMAGLAEAFWHVRRWETPRWKRWIFHLVLSLFNTVLTRVTVAIPIFHLIRFLQGERWGVSHLLGLDGMYEVIATFVLFDYLDYWWHRFNHTVPFLWRFHKPHHLDTHVDVTTALRFHPGELLLSYLAKSLWIFFWGPSLLGFVVFEAGITAYSQFHHSNIDFPDLWEKRLRWIHMTPRLHTSHHTVSLRTRSANYSTVFLIWDRLFGTLKEPDFTEMKSLGLSEGRTTYLSPVAFLKSPFVLLKGRIQT